MELFGNDFFYSMLMKTGLKAIGDTIQHFEFGFFLHKKEIWKSKFNEIKTLDYSTTNIHFEMKV